MENYLLQDIVDICLIIYLDDLLVYLKTQEEHDSHVPLVLKSNGKILILPFMRDPSTCERKHVGAN